MLKGLKQAVGLGEAAAAATTVPTVTPPVKTVATALAAKLAALNADRPLEAGRSADDWAALSAALKEGGCTSCPDDLRSLQDAVESPNSPSADAFWGELVPFACAQAQRFEELFTEPIAIVDADAGGVGGVSRVVEWTQAQCLCIQCNAFLCSWPERTSSNCGCTERDARALGLPSINFDEMHCGGGNFKKQLKRADKTGARLALLLGSDEMQSREVGVKPLRDGQEQVTVSFDTLADKVAEMLSAK